MAELPPGLVHEIDQAYAGGREDLHRMVEVVRRWVDEHGPAVASIWAARTLREGGWTDEMLAGLASVAVVEVIRSESGGDPCP
jgi:hypothetical protein